NARPPTKVTVTQPHGQLLQITNGVPVPLTLSADNAPPSVSTASTLPVPEAPAQDKRSLRSQDGGSRLKSDLTTYFSNYEDIIAGLPEPSGIIRTIVAPSSAHKTPPTAPQSSTTYQVLSYASMIPHVPSSPTDPLPDTLYFPPHRRAERKEKQLRNIEKERAMHEKVQLERLLDGLLGPDWLKVMGVTGVTDGDRKEWEPKRDYFVREVEALVDKFRVWKEEEKRLRAEREAAHAAREDDPDAETPEADKKEKEKESKPSSARRPPRPHGFLLPLPPPEHVGPFTSFYAKPHLRAQAMGKHRHGRNVTAFGQPIPEFEGHDFEIPAEYITPEALRDHARKRRRQRRESK
ncbi:hypothetical protein M011DRAFT_378260, partial [Sporormia fimetaria CBS 119925]